MAGDPHPKPTRRRRTVGQQSAVQVAAVRARIFDRDEHRCLAEHVLVPCFGSLTIQHAIGRGMGGSALLDRPSLLRTFCLGHNRLETESATFRALCLEFGWSLSRFGDVKPVPVRYPGCRWYLLDDDFGRDEVWP